ncbi:hypothetical protein SAMN05192574_107103 [Mucilaginibacter gossypiicola]|uniref:Uncharacterized protein n=1 Tax=Mucilaginibacter gossypiicola TaxID=551995 RepID=A0A1H8NUP0_9SPHI|nr:hypothetical protein [Mucilaginibacter gossypiicola]SEO33314.1 hypothetical protein SAMN05192574_107103 [Mucilaginibacter gossypiicola]
MQINQSDGNGFNISIRTISAVDNDTGAVKLLSAGDLGEQVKEFITSALLPGQDIHLAVSFEKWDNACVLEETVYRIMPNRETEHTSDYNRNYWIETKIK